MEYIIRKTSRTEYHPYSGPTCENAGVPVGKVYIDKAEAETDAERLSACNPVGFVVVQLPEKSNTTTE